MILILVNEYPTQSDPCDLLIVSNFKRHICVACTSSITFRVSNFWLVSLLVNLMTMRNGLVGRHLQGFDIHF